MARFTGTLRETPDGPCLETTLSAEHEQTFEIPLQELFHEFMGTTVAIEVHRLVPLPPEEPPARARGDDGE